MRVAETRAPARCVAIRRRSALYRRETNGPAVFVPDRVDAKRFPTRRRPGLRRQARRRRLRGLDHRKEWLLEENGDQAAQIVGGNVFYVLAVDRDRACMRVVEAAKKF